MLAESTPLRKAHRSELGAFLTPSTQAGARRSSLQSLGLQVCVSSCRRFLCSFDRETGGHQVPCWGYVLVGGKLGNLLPGVDARATHAAPPAAAGGASEQSGCQHLQIGIVWRLGPWSLNSKSTSCSFALGTMHGRTLQLESNHDRIAVVTLKTQHVSRRKAERLFFESCFQSLSFVAKLPLRVLLAGGLRRRRLRGGFWRWPFCLEAHEPRPQRGKPIRAFEVTHVIHLGSALETNPSPIDAGANSLGCLNHITLCCRATVECWPNSEVCSSLQNFFRS